jgi:hypothetical protein
MSVSPTFHRCGQGGGFSVVFRALEAQEHLESPRLQDPAAICIFTGRLFGMDWMHWPLQAALSLPNTPLEAWHFPACPVPHLTAQILGAMQIY